MIKLSKVFYPHIVKKYDTVEQYVSENNYELFEQATLEHLANHGIDTNDSAQYVQQLSEDGFEVMVTVVFQDSSVFDAFMEVDPAADLNRRPIFEEEVDTHLI